jgi:hypothetical protein
MRGTAAPFPTWAVRAHAVCIIDTAGKVLQRLEIAHTPEGLTELMRRLARFGSRLRIAIERPSGLIVDARVDAGPRSCRSTRMPSRPAARATAATAPRAMPATPACWPTIKFVEFVQSPPAQAVLAKHGFRKP